VRIVPETSFVQWDAQVATIAAGGRVSVRVETIGPRSFSIRGQVPVGHAPVVQCFEVPHPADFARAVLIEALRRHDVRVSASPLRANPSEALPPEKELAGLPEVAEYTSPPFSEYLKVVLKPSQNLHASLLPVLLAVRHGESHLGDGLKREGAALKALGLDTRTISFGGGAGGSDSDLVTARATVALLRAMAARPDFPAFEAALPVLGRDGTLAEAVPPGSPARGHARAKTGTYYVENGLDGSAVLTSKALAGYLETASGRQLTFAFFINNVPLRAGAGDPSDATAAAGKLLGRLCEVFYDDATGAVPNSRAAAP
jgi:D-alanyl-D-alanine carboxypeptidase/D-alanyl-D-alanine-endopeptidase (penicillin-binding protein 4)